MDEFWHPHLPPSHKGTRWLNVLKTLVAYGLIDPGSEYEVLPDNTSDKTTLKDFLAKIQGAVR